MARNCPSGVRGACNTLSRVGDLELVVSLSCTATKLLPVGGGGAFSSGSSSVASGFCGGFGEAATSSSLVFSCPIWGPGGCGGGAASLPVVFFFPF